MILLIDNYDSFTYNLVQRIGELDRGADVRVERNDKISVDEIELMQPSHLLISPGPCTPRETGICPDVIRAFAGRIPILGVCLGHQAIADVYGGVVKRHDLLMHGKTSPVHHDGRGIFEGLANPFIATRYHSLIVDRATIGDDFEISAWTEREDGQQEVMGLRWIAPESARAPMDGVQFHPESFLTTAGPRLLANFLGLPAPERSEVQG